MPDPRLQILADQFDAMLKKLNVGAVVLLASPTHTHYLIQLEANWSCITLENGFLRIRSKKEDYPSIEAQKKVLGDSVGMLAGFITISDRIKDNFERILMMLNDSGCEVEHRSVHEKLAENKITPEEVIEKAIAFDRLIRELSAKLPVEAKIKQRAGLGLAEALRDFVIIPKAEWEARK